MLKKYSPTVFQDAKFDIWVLLEVGRHSGKGPCFCEVSKLDHFKLHRRIVASAQIETQYGTDSICVGAGEYIPNFKTAMRPSWGLNVIYGQS